VKAKVDTKKIAEEAVDKMKQLTNSNVKAIQVASAPVAVASKAPVAKAAAAPLSTNELSRDLEVSKLPG